MSKVYTKEEAIKLSIEYFKENTLAAEVFVGKYALKNKKLEYIEATPAKMHKRLAKEFARIESKFPNSIPEEEIFELIDQFKYLIPGGSPMSGIGNPYQRVSLSNCFVIDTVDSYGGICKADERIAQISKRRGGVGLDISSIRPRGVATQNSALTTDGISVFMERFSNTSKEVAQQGRRGALMISLSCHHPEILTFIKSKRDLTKITGANISVRITDEFMNAVKKDKNYELRWPVDSKEPVIKSNIKAREVWDELVKSNYLSAEPGILFWDTILQNSPADCYSDVGFKTISTNPCITGETLVYVADGRGNVSIKELADKGEDVPVFCYDDKKNVVVRTMRNPRVTGYNQKIYKVTLDDGSIIRATANHEITLRNGEKRIDELKSGDSLRILTKYTAPLPSSIKAGGNRKSKNKYYWISSKSNTRAEHRFISEFLSDRNLDKKEVVHHKDYNGLNNSCINLEVMSENQHNKFHSRDMMGDKNPMRRAKSEWSKEKWQQYHDTMSKAVSGKLNGRFLGADNDALKLHAIKLTKELNRRFSKKDWQKYARKNKLPIGFSNWRKDNVGKVVELAKWAAIECEMEYIDIDPRLVKTLRSMIEQGYKAFIDNEVVFVEKECEECGKKFIKHHMQREISFCSRTCSNYYLNRHGVNEKRTSSLNATYEKKSNKTKEDQLRIFTTLKFNLGRMPLMKEWERECKSEKTPWRLKTKYGFKSYKEIKENAEFFNHRVVSVEFDGYQDVYNGTVDDYHNFFMGGFEGKMDNGNDKWVYINSKNCGELPLNSCDSCRLMSINLTAYVEDPFSKNAHFNIDKFKIHINKCQRLMDDLVELETESVSKIISKIESDPEDDSTKYNELSLWKEILTKCQNGRRTGLGITALGDCIAMLNIKYGSPESIETVEMIYSNLRNEAYKASIEMAKERGKFPIFDAKKEEGNLYLERLPEEIKLEMKKYGRRNIGCLTTPPAGSGSTIAKIGDLFGTSSGFEPVFKVEYRRKRKLHESNEEKEDFIDDMGDRWKEYIITHSGLEIFKKITGKSLEDSPYHGAQAEEIDFKNRVAMQAMATKYVDHAISSTVNLPFDIDEKTVSDIYISAWEKGCKGLTIYRSGSRDGVLTSMDSTRNCEDCDTASKDLVTLIEQGNRPNNIIIASAPKRPNVVECDIHRSKVGGGDWLFFVGKHNGRPYEIFGGDNEIFIIPQKYKKGWIRKNGGKDGVSQYDLILGSLDDDNEKLEIKGIAIHFNNYQYGAFTRLTSLTMRHGTPIRYICEQITKKGVEGDLFSFQRALSRILKKYISEGEKSQAECPMCHGKEVYYKNGCPTCKICGHSACS